MLRQFMREVNLLKALPRLIWTNYLGETRHELGSYTAAVVEQFIAIHQEETPAPRVQVSEPEPVGRPRLKGYINE